MSGFADISVFEGLQRNANNAMGFTGDVFTNVDNFSSGGASALTRKFKEKDLEASQEKDTELKKKLDAEALALKERRDGRTNQGIQRAKKKEEEKQKEREKENSFGNLVEDIMVPPNKKHDYYGEKLS